MRRILKTAGFISVLGFAVMSLSGCFLLLGAAAGAGSYAWVKGDMEKEYQVSASKLHSAAVRGLKKLDLPILEDYDDQIAGAVKSEFSDGKNVTVTVEAVTERSAKLRVRVGVFGDKLRSEMIVNAIEKYL